MKHTSYVVGFLFSPSMLEVALIRKNKPEWQRGSLNGIGGKVEDEETPEQAMRREFSEEADYAGGHSLAWKHFCSMSGINNDGSSFGIDFFYAVGEPNRIASKEEEEIHVFYSPEICSGDYKTVGNVPWLVALARDFGVGVHPPSHVEVSYSLKKQST